MHVHTPLIWACLHHHSTCPKIYGPTAWWLYRVCLFQLAKWLPSEHGSWGSMHARVGARAYIKLECCAFVCRYSCFFASGRVSGVCECSAGCLRSHGNSLSSSTQELPISGSSNCCLLGHCSRAYGFWILPAHWNTSSAPSCGANHAAHSYLD